MDQADDKFGEGGVEKRISRIERWANAFDVLAKERLDYMGKSFERNTEEHDEIKSRISSLERALVRLNFYIGGIVAFSSIMGQIIAKLIANKIP